MSGFVNEIAAKVAANKWVGMISGWGIWSSSSVWYDRYVYPALMLRFGFLWGGVIAASVAMLICTGFLLWYQITKSSWISSTDEVLNEIVSSIKKIEGYGIFLKIIFFIPRALLELSLRLIAKRGKLGFVALSCLADPFVTISYFRNGNKNGLSKKDWALFFLSGIIANGYWILWTSVIVVVIKFVWKFVQT